MIVTNYNSRNKIEIHESTQIKIKKLREREGSTYCRMTTNNCKGLMELNNLAIIIGTIDPARFINGCEN